jgi:hypothetical protein
MQADMYAVGCVLLWLLGCDSAINIDKASADLRRSLKGALDGWARSGGNALLIDMVTSLLDEKPSNRPCAEECLSIVQLVRQQATGCASASERPAVSSG